MRNLFETVFTKTHRKEVTALKDAVNVTADRAIHSANSLERTIRRMIDTKRQLDGKPPNEPHKRT